MIFQWKSISSPITRFHVRQVEIPFPESPNCGRQDQMGQIAVYRSEANCTQILAASPGQHSGEIPPPESIGLFLFRWNFVAPHQGRVYGDWFGEDGFCRLSHLAISLIHEDILQHASHYLECEFKISSLNHDRNNDLLNLRCCPTLFKRMGSAAIQISSINERSKS